MKLRVVVLYISLAILAALVVISASEAADDVWADIAEESEGGVPEKGKPVSGGGDENKADDDGEEPEPTWLQRNLMLVSYVTVMLGSKLWKAFMSPKVQTDAPGGNVKSVHSNEEWQTTLQDAKASKQLLIVDFSASWCGPCKMIAPEFARLSLKYPGTAFVKIDCDELKAVAKAMAVTSYPTFMVFRDGEKLGEVTGASADKVEKLLNNHGAVEEQQAPTDKATAAGKSE